jgi:hypothetical protein
MKNRTFHSDFLKRRKEWFSAYATAHTAMWWILAGQFRKKYTQSPIEYRNRAE